MIRVLIQMPHESGAWEISGIYDNQEDVNTRVEALLEEYKKFAFQKEQGRYEHWETFKSHGSKVATYRSIGWLRQESDQMMWGRPEFGVRPTGLGMMIELEDALQRWGKSAQPAVA